MTEETLRQLETAVLQIYLPGISRNQRKAIRHLCREKGVDIFSHELQTTLTNLFASVIRHRETDYESMCAAVGKERARFYTQPIVGHEVETAKHMEAP
jgi:hypothetical protein